MLRNWFPASRYLFFIVCVSLLTLPVHAGWRDFVSDIKDDIKQATEKPVSNSLPKGLTEKEIVRGLKQALRIGSKKSVSLLGKTNGFFRDAKVKILMPKKLRKAEKLLRKLGQKKMADDFIKTMNRAAESAVKTTFSVFSDAIHGMSIKDAVRILKGRDNEATLYFKDKKSSVLRSRIIPIVKQATQKTGVTKKYKKLLKRMRKIHPFLSKDLPDIDQYVTAKAMDGLFLKIAEQEKKIRTQPMARTTSLLKKVFAQR